MVDLVIGVLALWTIVGGAIAFVAVVDEYEYHEDKAPVLIFLGGPVVWMIVGALKVLKWGSRGYGD